MGPLFRALRSSISLPARQAALSGRGLYSSGKAAPKTQPTALDFKRMTIQSVGLFVISGVALLSYYYLEKERLRLRKEADNEQGYGKPLVGGPFCLVDHDGCPVTEKSFSGKYMLIYFGYTFCPDICPEGYLLLTTELEKMALIVDGCTLFIKSRQ